MQKFVRFFFEIDVHDRVQARFSVDIGQILVFQRDDGKGQNHFAVQPKKIGTFDHFAEILVFDGEFIFEFAHIPRGIYEHRARALFGLRAHHYVIGVADDDGIGIAEGTRRKTFGQQLFPDRRTLGLRKAHAVRRIRVILRLSDHVFPFVMAGIEQVQQIFFLVDDRAARKTAALVGRVGRKRHGQILEIHEIFAARVPPVHRAPFQSVRIVLVKNVKIPVVIH